MRTAKISASADMLDHRSVQPPNLLKKRFETPKPCRAEVLPEREASRKAALPYWSRMRRISPGDVVERLVPRDALVLARAARAGAAHGVFQAVLVIEPLDLADAAGAGMQRRQLGLPARRIGRDPDDLVVHDMGVDHAAAAAIVAAGAGDDDFAFAAGGARVLVDRVGHGGSVARSGVPCEWPTLRRRTKDPPQRSCCGASRLRTRSRFRSTKAGLDHQSELTALESRPGPVNGSPRARRMRAVPTPRPETRCVARYAPMVCQISHSFFGAAGISLLRCNF